MMKGCERLLSLQVLVLLDQLSAHVRPAVEHPMIDAWKQQYAQSNYGKIRRFKLLLLRGASQAGKTMRAEAIFGQGQTLILNCQGLDQTSMCDPG